MPSSRSPYPLISARLNPRGESHRDKALSNYGVRLQTGPVGVKQGLTFGGESVTSQRRSVALHRVEARGHQHHVGGKLIGDGHHHRPGGSQQQHGVFIQYMPSIILNMMYWSTISSNFTTVNNTLQCFIN